MIDSLGYNVRRTPEGDVVWDEVNVGEDNVEKIIEYKITENGKLRHFFEIVRNGAAERIYNWSIVSYTIQP